MNRIDARCLTYEKVIVFGKEMFFTDWRVDRSTIPEGLYVYEVRHCDDNMFEPAEISEHIWLNYFGLLISREPLEEFNLERNGRHFWSIEYNGLRPKEEHWQYTNTRRIWLNEIISNKAA
jgi:hypothetical protein